jgi:hypothetical protein
MAAFVRHLVREYLNVAMVAATVRLRALVLATIALHNVYDGRLPEATKEDVQIELIELGDLSQSSADNLLGGFLNADILRQVQEHVQKVQEEMSDARRTSGAEADTAPSQVTETQKETEGNAFGAEGKWAEASIETT